MPVTTGTSTITVQNLQTNVTLTQTVISLGFTSNPTLPFERVGYLYAFVNAGGSPAITYLLGRTPIYRPGTFLQFASNFGSSGVTYTIQAQWNKAGLLWRCATL